MWGMNNQGGLGDSTVISASSLIQTAAGGTNWLSVACGTNATNRFTLALKTDNTLWSWGPNNVGQLGSNTSLSRSSPVQVGTATNWKFIAAGAQNSYALKNDNTMWVWGRNAYGSLAISPIAFTSSPVQFNYGASDYITVCGGFDNTLFLKQSYLTPAPTPPPSPSPTPSPTPT